METEGVESDQYISCGSALTTDSDSDSDKSILSSETLEEEEFAGDQDSSPPELEKVRSGQLPRLLQLSQIIEELSTIRWHNVVEDELRKLVERRFGQMEAFAWDIKKGALDRFWAEEMPYPYSSFLLTDRCKFWTEAATGVGNHVESVARDLMVASATEACCERGFSFLHYIVSKRRKRLSHLELGYSLILKSCGNTVH
jgi:hypothetical protein